MLSSRRRREHGSSVAIGDPRFEDDVRAAWADPADIDDDAFARAIEEGRRRARDGVHVGFAGAYAESA